MREYFISLLKTRNSVLNVIALVMVWGFMFDTSMTIIYLIIKIDKLTPDNIRIVTDTLSLLKEVMFLVLGALIQKNVISEKENHK
ncbi:hypothetical protein [Emticicia sp.]|uniref:hypothetical protein n=1 Tax=Emticicia sp. TaxID=1930953 RepID=UPI0037539D14